MYADPPEGLLAANETVTVTVTLSNSGKWASEGQHERRPWFDTDTLGYGVVEFTFALTMTDDMGTGCRPSVPTNVRMTALPGNMPECEPFPDDPKPGREWRSLRVEWDAPSNPGSLPITAYFVTDGGFSWFGADTLTGTTLRCLLPDTEYFVGVRARNDHGYSPWSEPVSQWTRMPPSPPQNPGSSGSSSGGSGDGSLEDLSGYLENPGADSFQSGIGVISGWVCEAETVEIEIEPEQGEVQRQPAAYGTERVDTEDDCGDTDNGFGLLFNWNLLGDGEHEVVALVDGIELDRATVTVTTLGKEFLREGTGTCTVEDFPTRDKTVTLAWQQTQQNFVIVDGPAPAGTTNRAGTPGVGYLENPGPNSFQSGIGVISGWVCEAEEVEISLGGAGRQRAGYGTERLDTKEVCGDTDNGFGLLFNWNLLGDGEHEVVALVDGIELDRATVTVTTLGKEFLREGTGTCTVEDFPTRDKTVTLAWQQTQQNFVIVDGPAPAGTTNRAGTPGVGYLENPGPNSFQSGIGVISGWVCEGAEVIIELNGEPQPATYGTERLDTEEACGDTANGFGLLFNWNLLGDGEHTVVAWVDGVELGRAAVRVTTLGKEFVKDVTGECVVEDFPAVGETVTLEWQENSQNFVITNAER